MTLSRLLTRTHDNNHYYSWFNPTTTVNGCGSEIQKTTRIGEPVSSTLLKLYVLPALFDAF